MAARKPSALAAAIATLRTDVADLRDRRLTILDSIAQVEAAPMPAAEIGARIDGMLDSAARQVRASLNFATLSVPNGAEFEVGPSVAANPIGLAVVLGQRDTVRAAMLAEAVDAAKRRGGKPMAQAERDAELVKLRGELTDCERAEELVIREAEDAGAHIARRRDADPAVFLLEDL